MISYLHIQMVSRLVQEQDMRPLKREHRKRDTRFLTSGQRADWLQTGHAGYLEVAQVLAVLLLGLPGELARQELYGRHLRNEVVDVVLGEVPTTGKT